MAMDAESWEEDMTYVSYNKYHDTLISSDRVLVSMHGMYPPILGYFFPSGKKDFLKLIPK